MIRCLTLIASLACFTAPAFAAGQTHKDSDWNTAFQDSCGLPSRTSVEPVAVEGDRKLRFTLNEGEKGKCSTDNQRRHSAPYWERAELSQVARMKVGARYQISAEVMLMQGFTGERESFFQIHGWAKNCKKAYPPVMLKFKKGKLAVETLRGVTKSRPGNHRNVLRKTVRAQSLYGKPVKLTLDFDTRSNPGLLSVSLGGTTLVSGAAVEFAACAKPYAKFGIYRPGGKGSGTSVVVFDDLRVEQVE